MKTLQSDIKDASSMQICWIKRIVTPQSVIAFRHHFFSELAGRCHFLSVTSSWKDSLSLSLIRLGMHQTSKLPDEELVPLLLVGSIAHVVPIVTQCMQQS